MLENIAFFPRKRAKITWLSTLKVGRGENLLRVPTLLSGIVDNTSTKRWIVLLSELSAKTLHSSVDRSCTKTSFQQRKLTSNAPHRAHRPEFYCLLRHVWKSRMMPPHSGRWWRSRTCWTEKADGWWQWFLCSQGIVGLPLTVTC